jgi:NAD(P)-dependent dehydrogenase (short-subunit alcohol dehydrogenase family)
MLITGGSRGIGAATARLAAQKGWAIAIVYRDRSEQAAAVVQDITSAGGRALAIQADVAREADIVRAFKAADALGQLTALVNNAGISGGVSRVDAVTGAQLRSCVRAKPFCACRPSVADTADPL